MVNRLATNPELLEELGHKIKKSEFNHTEKENPKSSSLERGKSLGNRGSASESNASKNIKSSATMPTEMISLNAATIPSTGSLEKNSTAGSYHHRKQERKNSAGKSETISSASKADLVSGIT